MDAAQVLARIDELEHRITALRKQEQAAAQEQAGESGSAAAQVAEVQRELDRLWDLRRRQDAARAAGADEPTEVRPAATVEDYRQ